MIRKLPVGTDDFSSAAPAQTIDKLPFSALRSVLMTLALSTENQPAN
jgi:hypothetical protein